MQLDQAIEHMLDGNAVLFAGAGFSLGAINLNGEPLKTGAQLAEALSFAVPDTESLLPLEDAAEEYLEYYGEDHFIEFLKKEFTVNSVGVEHQSVAAIPWRRLYTTNYDDVIEKAYSLVSRSVTSVSLADNYGSISNTSRANTLCVHLNGYVNRLNRTTLMTDLQLTDSSYVTSSIAESAWSSLFRDDLGLARSVVFLGYSLSDLDIRRLLYETPSLKDKCVFC